MSLQDLLWKGRRDQVADTRQDSMKGNGSRRQEINVSRGPGNHISLTLHLSFLHAAKCFINSMIFSSSTGYKNNACTWFGDIYSCCCVPILPATFLQPHTSIIFSPSRTQLSEHLSPQRKGEGIEKGGSAFVVQCFVMFTPEVVAAVGRHFFCGESRLLFCSIHAICSQSDIHANIAVSLWKVILCYFLGRNLKLESLNFCEGAP